MKLKSFKYIYCLAVIFFCSSTLNAEDKIDIWSNKDKKPEKSVIQDSSEDSNNQKLNIDSLKSIEQTQKIEIEKSLLNHNDEDEKIFGIYDPEDNDLDLNMWSTTQAEDVKASLKRIEKIKLSNTANEILGRILLSFSYPPKGMADEEFADLKVNWLIKNKRSGLIENFLKQNEEFKSKSKAVQYLVDENIANANIKEGCEKIKFIDKKIKDAYLEKFKIYCLVFNDKKLEAQLLLDLLREQKQSDKFYDDKINFLLGVTDKTIKKVNQKNLLNF